MSEIFGRKIPYIAGYAVFTVASFLCGFATDLQALIAYRLLQGIGGGLLGSNSITILTKAVGPGQRGRAMGLYAAAQAIGISAGPVVGGLLLGTVGWQWVFWVSVPFGLAGVIFGWLVLPQTVESKLVKQFDHWGAMLLSPALAAFVISLSELGTWRPEFVLVMMFITAILLPPFIIRERSRENPLIDFRLFRIAPFLGGIIGVSSSYGLLYGMLFVMSFAFVRGFNRSPVSAGVHLAVIPIVIGIAAPISGRLYEKYGSRTLTTVGMGLCSIAIILLASGSEQVDQGTLIGGLALFGLGLGVYITPNNAATIAAAPDERNAEAGGVLNLMRVLGCMGGIVIASSALTWRLRIDTGFAKQTSEVPTFEIMSATHQALWALLFFSVLAGIAAIVRNRADGHS